MLRIIVVDEDEQYVQKLATYIRSQHEAKRLSLDYFTQVEAFIHTVDYTKGGHALYLIHESLSGHEGLEPLRQHIVWLSEQHTEDGEGAVVRLFKYQPLNQLMAKLLVLQDDDRRNHTNVARSKTCSTIAIYSAVGGSGKTTIALNLARQFSEQGKNVFLLNFELFSSLSAFFASDVNDPFSRLLYYARTRPQRLEEMIEQFKCYDHKSKISYLPSPVNLRELSEMTEADVHTVLKSLSTSPAYDYIIIDLPTNYDVLVWSAMKHCDQLLWLLVDDLMCWPKSQLALTEIKHLEQMANVNLKNKTKFILNKYTGREISVLDKGLNDVTIDYCLPYIPEWKNAESPKSLLSSAVFNSQLAQLKF